MQRSYHRLVTHGRWSPLSAGQKEPCGNPIFAISTLISYFFSGAVFLHFLGDLNRQFSSWPLMEDQRDGPPQTITSGDPGKVLGSKSLDNGDETNIHPAYRLFDAPSHIRHPLKDTPWHFNHISVVFAPLAERQARRRPLGPIVRAEVRGV